MFHQKKRNVRKKEKKKEKRKEKKERKKKKEEYRNSRRKGQIQGRSNCECFNMDSDAQTAWKFLKKCVKPNNQSI